MIEVQEVIGDPDMTDPQPWVVQRTLGQWQVTGFVNTQTTLISTIGPVRVVTDREIEMLPEADRVGQKRAFYSPLPLLLARGNASTQSVLTQVPSGAIPGTVYALATQPQGGAGSLYKNGRLLSPDSDYALSGVTITLTAATQAGDRLWFSSPTTVFLQAANSDVIQYDNSQYRVVSVYRTPGSGYWKAIATRLEAA